METRLRTSPEGIRQPAGRLLAAASTDHAKEAMCTDGVNGENYLSILHTVVLTIPTARTDELRLVRDAATEFQYHRKGALFASLFSHLWFRCLARAFVMAPHGHRLVEALKRFGPPDVRRLDRPALDGSVLLAERGRPGPACGLWSLPQ